MAVEVDFERGLQDSGRAPRRCAQSEAGVSYNRTLLFGLVSSLGLRSVLEKVAEFPRLSPFRLTRVGTDCERRTLFLEEPCLRSAPVNLSAQETNELTSDLVVSIGPSPAYYGGGGILPTRGSGALPTQRARRPRYGLKTCDFSR